MAYDKYTWVSGETITAQKLNHIEDGIEDAESGGGGALVVNFLREEGTKYYYDKTWQQVHDAIVNGVPCYWLISEESSGYYRVASWYAIDCVNDHGVYYVKFNSTIFTADDADSNLWYDFVESM